MRRFGFNYCRSITPSWQFTLARVLVLAFIGLLSSVSISAARDLPPQVAPPKLFVLPAPQVRTLPNGLTLSVTERRALPILTLRLLVKSGAESDPPNLPGTAQLTAEVLAQGTTSRSAQEIAEAIDFVGGNLSTGAGWDDSYAELTVLSDQAELAFDLLSDVVRRPAFLPAEIARKQQQTVSALEILRDDPAYMADAVFNVLVFKGTEYGHPLDGTEGSVQKLEQKDLRDFHSRQYQPGNCILAVVGDISIEVALKRAEASFGDWSASGQVGDDVKAAPIHETQGRIVVIDKPDAVQTEIRVGNRAASRDSPDYYALTAANQILGGPAANRLFKTLRSRQGLTYGASSELIFQQTAGSWVAKTSTRTQETMRSLRAVLDEMNRLRRDSIRPSELQTAKSYLIGHMALEFETSNDIARQALELMVHNLPLDYWNHFPEQISLLDASEVSAMARKYLAANPDVIVLIGDARQFAEDLREIGPVEIIPLRELDLASPDLRRPAAASGL